MPIYKGNNKVINDEDQYYDLFEKRGVKQIVQYDTIKFPQAGREVSVSQVEHVWSHGDKYYKLAYQYYRSYKYWWVIAYWNGKPTDAHLNYGDVIRIPLDLSKVLSALGE